MNGFSFDKDYCCKHCKTTYSNAWMCSGDFSLCCYCVDKYECEICEFDIQKKFISKKYKNNIVCLNCENEYCIFCLDRTDYKNICDKCEIFIYEVLQIIPSEIIKNIINFV